MIGMSGMLIVDHCSTVIILNCETDSILIIAFNNGLTLINLNLIIHLFKINLKIDMGKSLSKLLT